jgi:hypothetical protein
MVGTRRFIVKYTGNMGRASDERVHTLRRNSGKFEIVPAPYKPEQARGNVQQGNNSRAFIS